MKHEILKSGIAMLVAWLLGTAAFLLHEGTGGSLMDVFGLYVWTGVFAFFGWLIFVLPITKPIVWLLSKNETVAYGFPLLSAVWGWFVLSVMMMLFMGTEIWVEQFRSGPMSLTLVAAGIGFIWGLLYVLLRKSNFLKAKG